MIRWENSVGGVETEEARHTGEHMEGDNRGKIDANVEALEEIRHMGAGEAAGAGEHSTIEGHEESRDLQRTVCRDEPVSGFREAEEGGVAEPRRAEQAGGGIHQEVQ